MEIEVADSEGRESTVPLDGEEGGLARERAAPATLESSVRAMDEFMALLSHDLRSPLSAMVGWLHVLRGGQATPEMTERALAGLASSVERQRRLVDHMVDAARIVTGRINLATGPVNAAALLRRLTTRFNARAAEKSIVLDVTPVDQDAMMLADPMRIEEALATLIDHAIGTTPLAGRVVLSARVQSGSIDIDVTDSGAGFLADELAWLFAPSGQSDLSGSRGYGSFALGLIIAKALAELQGGTLAATSRGRGQGASFVLICECDMLQVDGRRVAARTLRKKKTAERPSIKATRRRSNRERAMTRVNRAARMKTQSVCPAIAVTERLGRLRTGIAAGQA
jgi:signal transduction histidine kinase